MTLHLLHVRASQQTGGPHQQHQNQQAKSHHILVFGLQIGRGETFRQTQHDPPSIAPGMLPIPPSTAAVNAFSPAMKADERVDQTRSTG
jgi:hypothetical protein